MSSSFLDAASLRRQDSLEPATSAAVLGQADVGGIVFEQLSLAELLALAEAQPAKPAILRSPAWDEAPPACAPRTLWLACPFFVSDVRSSRYLTPHLHVVLLVHLCAHG